MMNIQTVAENLRNTIAGKEALLAELKGRRVTPEVSIHYLEINIDELQRILEDVEQCSFDWTEYLNPVTGEK